jgi:hypothetical protein
MGSAWDSTPAAPVRSAAAPASAAGAALTPAQSAWDATAAPAPATPPRGLVDQAGDFLSAFGHHLANLPHGVAQFVQNDLSGQAKAYQGLTKDLPQPVQRALEAVPLVGPLLTDNPLSKSLISAAASDNQAINERNAAYQKSTPTDVGSVLGATAGEVAPFLVSGPTKALTSMGDAVTAKVAQYLPQGVAKVGARAAGGAAQGAAMATAQPVDTSTSLSDLVTGSQAPSFWDQKLGQVGTGAAFGGALPVAAAGVGSAWNAGKRAIAESPILNPSTYAAKQIGIQLGADAPTITGDLVGAPTYVPGSAPTAAQAGADPRLVMMEKSLANENPKFKAALAARENANNAARLQAVADVAKTPQALADAITQRTTVTAPMRDFTVTNGNPVPVNSVDQALGALAGGPLGVRPTIGNAASAMRSELGDLTNVTPPNTLTNTPGAATASPAMLDALRQNANDYLSKFAPQGFVGTQEQAAMTPVKSAIVDAIDAANPGHKLSAGGWGQGLPQMGPQAPSYRDYLSEFAKRSVPINTMEVGQHLQAKLLAGGLNSAGDAATALPGYRSALAQALRNSDYAIDPQAQAALEGVQSDLQRATISNSIKSGGSDTAYNEGAGKEFLRALGAASGSNVPAALAGGTAFAATGSATAGAGAAMGAKKAGGWVTGRVGDALGDLLLDPQKLADALNASAKPAAAAAPTTFDRLLEQMSPRAKALAISQLLQQQAPQVVAPDPQRQQAYQP